MKIFFKILALVFVIDIALGFSISYLADNISNPNYFFLVIDELISFPVSIWNRLFPEYGIYRTSTNVFWLVIIFNCLCQTLVLFGFIKFFQKFS